MGMGHAGVGTDQYGDSSDIMGYVRLKYASYFFEADLHLTDC